MNTVDVVQAVCAKDNPLYLREAIESILAQTRPPDRYIIVCDDSLNQVQEQVLKSAGRYLTVIKNNRKKGLAGSLNSAILHSKADILVRMDSDDLSVPHRLEILIRQFEEDPQLLLIGSGAIEIDHNGKTFYQKWMPLDSGKIIEMAMTRNPFIHSSIAYKRELFEIIGLYNERYQNSQDYELWARIFMHFPGLTNRLKNIDALLVKVRLSENFWSKRSLTNIRFGTPISIRLIHHFKEYHRLIPLAFKVLLRLSPEIIKKYAYRDLR
jgi:glycosyltransferase involved in cell wall biosynthesis